MRCVAPSADSGACSRSSTRTCSSRPRSRRFALLASPALINELSDALARLRFLRWISIATAAEFVAGLEESAVIIDDPPEPAVLTADPDDDCLIALAQAGVPTATEPNPTPRVAGPSPQAVADCCSARRQQ
jgi:hypothetical protein